MIIHQCLRGLKIYLNFLHLTVILIPPAVEFAGGTGGPTIIDNSVKSVNQNNQTQAVGMNSRNNDSSFHITNRYKDV